MRAKVVALIGFTLALGCATGLHTDEPDSSPSPVEPESPTVTAVDSPENIDGEYAMRVDPTSFICEGVPSEYPVIYAIANVVEQSSHGVFDLLPRGTGGGFADFSHWNVKRKPDGDFDDGYELEYYLTPGYPPVILISDIVGSVESETLAFTNKWTAGSYDVNGDFQTGCEIIYDDIGFRRYLNWNDHPRPSIDGQWRVLHEAIEDPADPSGEPRYLTIDTITQNSDGTVFDLKGTRFSFKNVPRAPDGGVHELVWYSSSQFEIEGVVENDYLDLYLTRDWYDPITWTLIWHTKDRYVGTPRFAPHQPENIEPITGAFNTALTEAFDSCDGILNSRHYVVESLPADTGQIILWIAGLEVPPFIPNSDGTFGFNFERNGFWRKQYRLDGKINSDALSFTLKAEATWGMDEVYCATDYIASGVKRYLNLFPPEP